MKTSCWLNDILFSHSDSCTVSINRCGTIIFTSFPQPLLVYFIQNGRHPDQVKTGLFLGAFTQNSMSKHTIHQFVSEHLSRYLTCNIIFSSLSCSILRAFQTSVLQFINTNTMQKTLIFGLLKLRNVMDSFNCGSSIIY